MADAAVRGSTVDHKVRIELDSVCRPPPNFIACLQA